MSPKIIILFCMLYGAVLCQDSYSSESYVGAEAYAPATFFNTICFGNRTANDTLLNLDFGLLQLPSGQITTKLFSFPNKIISQIQVIPLMFKDLVSLGSGGSGSSLATLVFNTVQNIFGKSFFIVKCFGK